MHPHLKSLVAGLLELALFCTSVAACVQSNKAAIDAAQKESYAYILTMDRINRLGDARKAMGKWFENNEQASKQSEGDKSLFERTFAERARAFDSKYPEAAAIIRKQGISTHEYLLGTHVLVQALSVDAKENSQVLESKTGGGVNPSNLTFVEQHWEEIHKSMQDVRIRM